MYFFFQTNASKRYRERERIIGINTQGRKEEKEGGTRREGKEEKVNKQKSKTG